MNDIQIGDKYYNPKSPHLGVRIATQETLDRIAFTKAIAYGTCYYIKVDDTFNHQIALGIDNFNNRVYQF